MSTPNWVSGSPKDFGAELTRGGEKEAILLLGLDDDDDFPLFPPEEAEDLVPTKSAQSKTVRICSLHQLN